MKQEPKNKIVVNGKTFTLGQIKPPKPFDPKHYNKAMKKLRRNCGL